jgi:hypothetical protein
MEPAVVERVLALVGPTRNQRTCKEVAQSLTSCKIRKEHAVDGIQHAFNNVRWKTSSGFVKSL